MHKFIVITSIFAPTEGVAGFASRGEYELIVVGDKKTPSGWSCKKVTYLPVDAPQCSEFTLSRRLPYNHYCRKMLGYLYAMKREAEVIVDTDDDNIPRPGWGFPDFNGCYALIPGGLGFVNVYALFTDAKIWPRGYPLRRIRQPDGIPRKEIADRKVKVGVWQGLANGNPDVDAIYRLTSDQPCEFKDHGPYVLDSGTLAPFNSQNTAFARELFPLLYLPAFVSFRFTDILRGLIAQPIMWQHGYRLGFTNATVTQKRNAHDYMQDFESEIPMYLDSERILDVVRESVSRTCSLEDNLYHVYDALGKKELVPPDEVHCLEAWLSDCAGLRRH